MASKMTKQFKQRIQGEKQKKIKVVNIEYENNQLISIPITRNTVAKVRSKTVKLNEDEIIELVQDLFHIKKSFQLNERVETSKVCDVPYDLLYRGARLVDDIKEACFMIC